MANFIKNFIKKLENDAKEKEQEREALIKQKEELIKQICNEDPKEQAIIPVLFESVIFASDEPNYENFFKKTSAKIVLDTGIEGNLYVISEKILYQIINKQCCKQLIEDCNNFNGLRCMQIIHNTTYNKKSSVVGSAIAGGVIAGGAGAVVGAVSAVNTNMNGGKTVSKGSLGDYGIYYKKDWISNCYISDDVLNNFDSPFTRENGFMFFTNGYIRLNTYNRNKEFINTVINYLQQVTKTYTQN